MRRKMRMVVGRRDWNGNGIAAFGHGRGARRGWGRRHGEMHVDCETGQRAVKKNIHIAD